MNGKRVNYLTVSQNFALEAALAVFEKAGFEVYLVGSALLRRDFRDVDIRCILDDDKFADLFPNKVRLRLSNAAHSEWLSSRTGLPVDFQFQPYSDLKNHSGPRNAMGFLIESESAKAAGAPQ